jgi:hypothetical protein
VAEPGNYSLSANADGTVELEWPDGRPETVLISSALLEEWVAQRNRVTAMERLITIWRLGRRPSKADWDEADLPPIDPKVRIDIMARKIQR